MSILKEIMAETVHYIYTGDGNMHHGTHANVRRQLAGAGSLHHVSQESNPGH